MKDINIVILNYLMKEDVLRALQSLFADIKDCPFDVQVVVADNSSNKDGIKEAVESEYPLVRYLDTGGNIGFGKGNTAGFKLVPARYYFSLNPDTIIPANTRVVERIVKFMDQNPKIGCMGPKILNIDDSIQYSCYRFDFPSIFIKPLKQINWDNKYNWVKKYADRLIMKDFDHDKTMPVDWVLGAAMVVRKEVVDQVGWFDERYFMYLEDCDWCRTMWENGWPVYYVHDIVIKHGHTRASSKVPGVINALLKNKLARIHLSSWLKYIWKWKGNFKYYAAS